ncbi:RNA polymerase factor sigma-54 [Parasulfuritortus cantonensis]|uniref:RNA polymerase sigma-54 factor n=1 Tax=Parasulfuritortus cantonensis TaxID=2528202 RepID=A0A4R1BEB0_9PROT|nr:RNA polymerase factor sigma-54 [Parasulfuritortus cantonensis]TCJ15413.1 RNA polymerase factor sigma-54 [Parasulfuritortus cantonensis]
MKQSLQLKLSHQLALTPQLQQSIRLLQLSTQELNQEIGQMLQENPMLERADDAGMESGPGGSEEPAPAETSSQEVADTVYDEMAWGDRHVSSGGSDDDDDDDRGFQQSDEESRSLRQHLHSQLAMIPLSARDHSLVALMIEALDEDGYLGASLDELVDMVPESLEVDEDELLTALRLLQSMDPPGVGARDLGESLFLQLNELPPDTPYLAEAKVLVSRHLDLLAEREYGKLKRLLGIDNDRDFIGVRQLITSLNPRPAASFDSGRTQYVVPDVFVRKVKGEWVVSLNPEAMPKLRINEVYANILRQNRGSGGQLSGQMQEARWLIKNVQQRFQTILKVAQAIVDRQRMFFEHGEVAMRPLVLREIAESVGLHESTISRVTNQKYMMTPRGLYEFKYFFGNALATEAGGAASSTAIKALLKQFVEAEDRTGPLSDSALSEMLGKQGFVVARRTVAKYREQMNIPPANQRKSL